MLGVFGLRLPRAALYVLAGGLLVALALTAAFFFGTPHATLRITTGAQGGIAQRFVDAFIATSSALHPHIRFETVTVDDLSASAKALEQGKVDIALVRSDVAAPSNGDTLVILRRDAVAIVVPAGSPIENVSQLAGKTVAVATGPAQAANSHALDLILSYFNVPAESVKRVFLPVADIGAEIHHKRAAAALAVGPIGPGPAVDVVASIAKAIKGKPSILAIDEADAISARFPGLESLDLPEGAFKAHPAIPDDTVTTLAITYRFAVPATMLKPVAGAIARSILKTKARLMAATPLANQIEAPDPDEKNPVMPIHPGVADYLSSGDQSFLDDLQQYVYIIGIPLSILASLFALVSGHFSKKKIERDQQEVLRLLVIADEAPEASAVELAALERELRGIVSACVAKLADGGDSADHASASLAIENARRSIDSRKAELAVAQAQPNVTLTSTT